MLSLLIFSLLPIHTIIRQHRHNSSGRNIHAVREVCLKFQSALPVPKPLLGDLTFMYGRSHADFHGLFELHLKAYVVMDRKPFLKLLENAPLSCGRLQY